MFTPEIGETLMSMRCRIFELQLLRATLAGTGDARLNSYVNRRILEIETEIAKLRAADTDPDWLKL